MKRWIIKWVGIAGEAVLWGAAWAAGSGLLLLIMHWADLLDMPLL